MVEKFARAAHGVEVGAPIQVYAWMPPAPAARRRIGRLMAPHPPPAPPAEGFGGAHEVATHVFTSAAIKQIGLYLIYSSGKRSMDIYITEETPPPPSPPPCGVNPPPPPEPEPMPSPGPFEYLGDGCCVHHVSTACSIQQHTR